ncbi:MAG: patatin-like phospholipase family protein [Venatoribacter sp.]
MNALKIYAGSHALQHIQNNGLNQADIKLMLAASGGPKWFANYAMDKFLLGEWFKNRTEPLHLLGTSAGAFRMACYAQKDPIAALDRFLEGYLSQEYSLKPTDREIGLGLERMLGLMLGEQGVSEILANPVMKFNTLVARFRGLGASKHKAVQAVGLMGALLGNLASPAAMRPFVERMLFHTSNQLPISHFPKLPVRRVPLNQDNLYAAVRATGSIPMVIDGIKDIAHAPKGTYRDGGVTDYQFDLPCKPKDGLVLYPHYSAAPPKGGWFDKALAWRKAQRSNYSHTIILAPSHEFAASLPGGKIPERQDFYDMTDYPPRRAHWEKSLQQMQQLGDELAEVAQQNRWAEVAEPLPF